MRSLLRPAPLFLLISYILLSAVPWFPVLSGASVVHAWPTLGAEVLAWCAVWAVFKRPAWFHWLLLPAFIGLPAEVYLQLYYNQSISVQHLGIIAETSPAEAMAFLGYKVWLMLALMVTVVAWWGGVMWAALRTRALDWTDASRWLVLAIMALAALVAIYGMQFGINGKPARKPAPILPPLPSWVSSLATADVFPNTWPFGLLQQGYAFYQQRVYLSKLGDSSRAFTFRAHQASPDKTPEVVILVIGESSRADRWSLLGYGRDTNPLLSQQSNLVTLPDLVTPVSATRLSVPVIITRKAATQSLKDGFYEKSLLTAYKEAGFKTWWISNQLSFGKFDTPVSVFANEANVVEFLNLGGFTDKSNFDSILLGPLQRALADGSPKKLIVLHTLGSHWNYSERYPKTFDKWQPSLFGVPEPDVTDLKIKPRMNNSYDSTILYTDWMLDQVIGQLKGTGAPASLLYLADHGDTLYDGTCHLAFHGHNTQFEFHIPGLAWYSDQYRDRYPAKVAQLLVHSKDRLATENVFHTLLDLGDIVYPGQHLDYSFASSQFRRHPRYVDSYGWTDYDNATLRGDCHEVIGKGKALKQEK